MKKFLEIWRNFTFQYTENWLSWTDLQRYIWKVSRIWFYYRTLNTMSNYSFKRNVLLPLSRSWKKGISPNFEKYSKFKKFHFSKFGEISPNFHVPWLNNNSHIFFKKKTAYCQKTHMFYKQHYLFDKISVISSHHIEINSTFLLKNMPCF